MFAFVAGRRQGKTEQIVNWWLENPEYRAIMVSDRKRHAHIIRRMLQLWPQHMPLPAPDWFAGHVIVAGPFQSGRATHLEVGVDDLEDVLRTLMQMDVQIVTMTATLINPAPRAPIRVQQEGKEDIVDGTVITETGRELGTRRALEEAAQTTAPRNLVFGPGGHDGLGI